MAKWFEDGDLVYSPPQLPRARYRGAAVLVGTEILVFGGQGASFGDETVLDIYDLVAETWSTGTGYTGSLPHAAVLGGLVYLLNGTDFKSYDPATDSYATLASASNDVGWGGLFAVGTKLYALGYWLGAQEYDPSLDSWTTKAAPALAPDYAGYAEHNGFIYQFGGQSGGYTDRTFAYEVATDTWAEVAAMNTARAQCAGVAYGGKIYALGGYFDVASCEEYDPIADTWVAIADIPTGRDGAFAVADTDGFHVFGGYEDASNTNLDLNEFYDPAASEGPSATATLTVEHDCFTPTLRLTHTAGFFAEAILQVTHETPAYAYAALRVTHSTGKEVTAVLSVTHSTVPEVSIPDLSYQEYELF